ncbi:serine threonine protein kinase [Nannochloropsis gaditana]|uniref:non-specific serine/threonine protein kinase n=1 Tax=Nannochloropsis gaditana TaxID=72520 RepID=W7THI3_9STRA|nr:serine threonine protein kinase [Nannochloropsis gaditana]
MSASEDAVSRPPEAASAPLQPPLPPEKAREDGDHREQDGKEGGASRPSTPAPAAAAMREKGAAANMLSASGCTVGGGLGLLGATGLVGGSDGALPGMGDGRDPEEELRKQIIEYSPQKRYVRFNEVLGKGAYKMVYRAYDTKEGLLVAWNTISLAGLPKQEKIRIMHEVRLLEQLDHGNIISFFGSWVNREREEVVFITEILSSGSLKDFIKKVQVIRWKIIKRWCRQILRGLLYLHSHVPPIIHRDLKCDNIFINGSSGDLRIGDLGLSTYITGRTAPLSVLGTPEFMAPELYDEKYDEKVDVYAFGMCVLEMVTKETPYSECANAAQIYKKVIGQVAPKVLFRVCNLRARDFIRSCLASDPSQRPSVQDLLESNFLKQQEEDDEEVLVESPSTSSSSSPAPTRPAQPDVKKEEEQRPQRQEQQQPPGTGPHSVDTLRRGFDSPGGGKASGEGGKGGEGGASKRVPDSPVTKAGGPSEKGRSSGRHGPGETLRRVSRAGKPLVAGGAPPAHSSQHLEHQRALRQEKKGPGGASKAGSKGEASSPSDSGGGSCSSDGDPAELRQDQFLGMHHQSHHHALQGHGAHEGGGPFPLPERTHSSHSLATSAHSEGSSSLHLYYDIPPTPALSHSGSEGTLESYNTSSPVQEGHFGGSALLEGPTSSLPAPPSALLEAAQHQHLQSLGGMGGQLSHHQLQGRERDGKHAARAASSPRHGGAERPPRHGPSPMSQTAGRGQQAPSAHHHHHHHQDPESWALLHVNEAEPPPPSAAAGSRGGPGPGGAARRGSGASSSPAMSSTEGNPPAPHQPHPQLSQTRYGGGSPGRGPTQQQQRPSASSAPRPAPTVQVRVGDTGARASSDVLCLVIRAKMKGKLRDIEFDFHLSDDDASQVAQEMVQELALPASDLGPVAATIRRLADESRRARAQEARERRDRAEMLPPSTDLQRSSSMEGVSGTMNVGQYGEPQQEQGRGRGEAEEEREVCRVGLSRSLSTNNMAHLAAMRASGQFQPDLSLDSLGNHQGQAHSRNHSADALVKQQLLEEQHRRQEGGGSHHIRSDASSDGGWSGGEGAGGGGRAGRWQMTGLPPHLQHFYPPSDDDLHRLSPAASQGEEFDSSSHSHAPSHLQGGASHTASFVLSSDDESTGERGDGGDDLDGDGEITRLRSDYEKGLQRSQKAFSIRLENMRKSRQEKEESHRKLLEKHMRDMADFERKVRTAEKEQIMRLQELEEQWRTVKMEHRERRRLAKQAAAECGSLDGPNSSMPQAAP